MQYTDNYNLKKPGYSEIADIPEHLNSNMDIIDLELKNNSTQMADLDTKVETHKAESVTKLVLVTEPFAQTTKTTVHLGFRPKIVNIKCVINASIYESDGVATTETQQVKIRQVQANNLTIAPNYIIALWYNGSNYILGAVTFTDTGIEINWTSLGTLTGASGERRLIISAITHGGGL